MKKVFISQPMSGLADAKIKEERAKATEIVKDYFKDEEVEIIDSYIEDASFDERSPVYFLGESIKCLSEADFIFFAKGWDHSRGCKIEHAIAENYRISYMEDFVGSLIVKVYK